MYIMYTALFPTNPYQASATRLHEILTKNSWAWQWTRGDLEISRAHPIQGVSWPTLYACKRIESDHLK